MRLLLIEDEPTLHQQIKTQLEAAHFVVDGAWDGVEGQYLGQIEPYDAIILDLGLPRLDGMSILRTWRSEGMKVPILILTARDRWMDKVTGIDAGADDYLVKPFHMEELLARLRGLIRRSSGLTHTTSLLTLTLPDMTLMVDTKSGHVTHNGQRLHLTSHEFKVLVYLMHRPNQVITKTELTEHIYGWDGDRDSNTIEVFIARLRKKIHPDLIQTLRGLGYRLESSLDV